MVQVSSDLQTSNAHGFPSHLQDPYILVLFYYVINNLLIIIRLPSDQKTFTYYHPTKYAVYSIKDLTLPSPSTITSLQVNLSTVLNLSFLLASDTNTYSTLQSLLDSLPKLSALQLNCDQSNKSYLPGDFKLPIHLQSLVITLIKPTITLPDSLLELDLNIGDNKSTFGKFKGWLPPQLRAFKLRGDKIHVDFIPPTLLELELYGEYFTGIDNILPKLPMLTKLQVGEEFKWLNPALQDHVISYLPPSIIHLQLPQNSLNPATPLPPKLETYKIIRKTDAPYDNVGTIPYLPLDTITKLVLHLDCEFSEPLPPNLIHLDIGRTTIKVFPPSLKYLSVNASHYDTTVFDLSLDNLSKLVSFPHYTL